jgi:hypothetical protein
MYIPPTSAHFPPVMRSWIRGECIRYIRGHTRQHDYTALKHLFYRRLVARGYNPSFLRRVLTSVQYSDRPALLRPRVREQQQQPTNPFVVVTTLHPSLPLAGLRQAMEKQWHEIVKDHPDWQRILGTESRTVPSSTHHLRHFVTRSQYPPVPAPAQL